MDQNQSIPDHKYWKIWHRTDGSSVTVRGSLAQNLMMKTGTGDNRKRVSFLRAYSKTSFTTDEKIHFKTQNKDMDQNGPSERPGRSGGFKVDDLKGRKWTVLKIMSKWPFSLVFWPYHFQDRPFSVAQKTSTFHPFDRPLRRVSF